MNISDLLQQVERFPVDPVKARRYRKNRRFLEMGFGLLQETTQLTFLVAELCQPSLWGVDDAVIGGSTIRMAKLSRAFLQHAKDSNAQLALVVARMLVEAAVNIQYLVLWGSPELFLAYRQLSLVHEVELERSIKSDVEVQGKTSPIQERMLRSISLAYKKSEILPSEIPSRKKNAWNQIDFKKKLKKLELEDLYSAFFGGPSRNVHGGWYDLLQHDLEWEEGAGFSLKVTRTSVRPQLLFALPYFQIPALRYAQVYFYDEISTEIEGRLVDLEKRIELGDNLHEEFLTKRMNRQKRAQ